MLKAPTPFAVIATPYAPETIESTELGLKGRYFDNRMMLNVAYFDNEHEDMQISYFTAMLQLHQKLLIILQIYLVLRLKQQLLLMTQQDLWLI